MPALKKGGILLYSTCSVFKKENEQVVGFVSQNFGMRPEKMELFEGYKNKADSMFVAALKA